MSISDVLLEGVLTFKTYIDKAGWGVGGEGNLKVLRRMSFMDGSIPKKQGHFKWFHFSSMNTLFRQR